MAYSYNRYISNGVTTTFTSPPYLEAEHISVEVQGVALETSAYTLTGTVVNLHTVPLVSQEIIVRRSTSPSTRLVTFTSTYLDEADLNRNADQLLYLMQEALDAQVGVAEYIDNVTSTEKLAAKVLTTGQTVVVFAETLGAEPYFRVNGESVDNTLLSEGTDYTLDLPNRTVTLAESYPAGTIISAYGLFTAVGGENYNTTQVAQNVIDIAQNAVDIDALGAKAAVSVKDFGAVGDGVTDDTQAIRDAIDAGSEIYFPAGTYYCAVDGNITKNGVTNKRIYGDGATLLKGGSKGVFYFLNSSNIEIHGLNFNGNVTADEAANGSILAATRASTDYAFAVVFEECSDCSFHDNYVYDFAWDGCVAYGIVAAGAASATYSSNIRVFRNRFRNIRGTMIWNKAVQNLWIAENNGTNDVGGSPFEQKGNFIFCVEFCDKVNIDQNHAYYIGDNFVGIGDQINDTSQALNRNITVTNNLFKTCRYHAILIAQVRDAVISGNIIEQAGAKDNMFPSSAVQCAGITMIGGVDGSRTSQPNSNVSIVNNVIYEPYEMGVYAFDRGLTTLSGGSTGITISGNKIIRAGQLALATRMTTRGITCQFPNMVVITDNVVKDVAGEGVRVFGDARLQRNEVYNSDDISIHVPDDTIFNNVSLSAVVADNVCVGSKRSGILIAGRQVTKTRGNKCEECGIDTVPVSETVATAYLYSGIGVYNTDHYLSEGDECNENGSSGICYRPSGSSLNKVRITNAMTSDNGSVFTTANLRSGVYAEGDGTTAVAATYIGCGGYTGTNQQYPIRQVFGGTSVSVDDVFDTHPNGILGATQKSLFNI